jgi:hypothetical protein
VCYIPSALEGYVVELDHLHCVGARDALGIWLGRMMSYALAETPNFVRVGLIPRGLVFWEPPELPVFKCLPGVVVQHRVGRSVRFHVVVNVVVLVICE